MSLGLAALLGGPGAVYLLLRQIWPTWYQDIVTMYAAKNFVKNMAEVNKNGWYLIDIFEKKAKEHPQKSFIIYEDVYYTYEYMDKKGNQACRTAIEIGIQPGSIVAVLMYNEPSIVWTYLGLLKGGYQIAFINFNLRGKSLAHCINISGANVLILGAGSELAKNVEEILPDIPKVMVYYMGSISNPKPARFLSWDLVMSRSSKENIDRKVRSHLTPKSTAVLIYTSGTTGDVVKIQWLNVPTPNVYDVARIIPTLHELPNIIRGLSKAAIIPHIRTLTSAHAFDMFNIGPDDVLYEPLPMYHAVALTMGLGGVMTHGATMVLKDKFSASQFWEDVRKYNVTIINYIGEVCRYLLARPKSEHDGVHKVRVATGNGLRQDIWDEFKTRFKIPKIVEYYGASEGTSGFVNLTNKTGAVGVYTPIMPLGHVWTDLDEVVMECFKSSDNVHVIVVPSYRYYTVIQAKQELKRKLMQGTFVKFDVETQAPVRNKEGRCIPTATDEVGLMIVKVIKDQTEFYGYHGNEKATKSKYLYDVFEEGDVYFNTGDLMRVDKDCYVYFNDRVGDTFRWKGENVSTLEVGNTLTELDFILDANVYGVQVPGGDGRAGMASLLLSDSKLTDLTNDMVKNLSNHVKSLLPTYARPKFIRIRQELQMTSTFKQQKTILVKEGFDVNLIEDPLYYLDQTTHAYKRLDAAAFEQIMAGKIKF